MDGEARRASRGSATKMYTPPSRVARKGMAAPSPRPPVGSTAEAIATARRAEYSSGGSILPVLTPPSQPAVGDPIASKRNSWTTPRAPTEAEGDDFHATSNESFAPPPRRAELAAARQRGAPEGLFGSETEQAQLAYMEQMYGTINLLNAELESERRSRAELEATVRPASHTPSFEVTSYQEASMQSLDVGEFDEPPTNFVVSPSPVAPSHSPRKLRAMSPASRSHVPSPPSRSARPPSSPRPTSVVKDYDPNAEQELCATLGKNAELRIRSRDMERSAEKAALELALARKQLQMAERRAANREEKLRALLKDKMNWQKELKAVRAQVVEEKMRQVDLFREMEAAKREFTTELEAVDGELRVAQDENAELRAQASEMKAQANFQNRRIEDMARQAKDEKERFVALLEDTRQRFHEWKEGEAAAMQDAHDEVVATLKTEFELKLERHQQEKEKLRDKVKDLEVSLRLVQKDRSLSPLELTLRKASILSASDSGATAEAELIEARARVQELEGLLAHSKEYQERQDHIMQISEATISRLMQEREVTALENLSLHPFAVDPRGLEAERATHVLQTARSPLSRTDSPKREELEVSPSALPSPIAGTVDDPLDGQKVDNSHTQSLPSSLKERVLMSEVERLTKELAEAQAKATMVQEESKHGHVEEKEGPSLAKVTTDSSDQVQREATVPSEVKERVEISQPCEDKAVSSALESTTLNADAGERAIGVGENSTDDMVVSAEVKDAALQVKAEQKSEHEDLTHAVEEYSIDVAPGVLVTNEAGSVDASITSDSTQKTSSPVADAKTTQAENETTANNATTENEAPAPETRAPDRAEDSKDTTQKETSESSVPESSEVPQNDSKETGLGLSDHHDGAKEHSEGKFEDDCEESAGEGPVSQTQQYKDAASVSAAAIKLGDDVLKITDENEPAREQLDGELKSTEAKADTATIGSDVGESDQDKPSATNDVISDDISTTDAEDAKDEAKEDEVEDAECKQIGEKHKESAEASLAESRSFSLETVSSPGERDNEVVPVALSTPTPVSIAHCDGAKCADENESATSSDKIDAEKVSVMKLFFDSEEKQTALDASYEKEEVSAVLETPDARENKQPAVEVSFEHEETAGNEEKLVEVMLSSGSEAKTVEMEPPCESEEKSTLLKLTSDSEEKQASALAVSCSGEEKLDMVESPCESKEDPAKVEIFCSSEEKIDLAEAFCQSESKQTPAAVSSMDGEGLDNGEKAMDLATLCNSEDKLATVEAACESESKPIAVAMPCEKLEEPNDKDTSVEMKALCNSEEKIISVEAPCKREGNPALLETAGKSAEKVSASCEGEEKQEVVVETSAENEGKQNAPLEQTDIDVTHDSGETTSSLAIADLSSEVLVTEAKSEVLPPEDSHELKSETDNKGEMTSSPAAALQASDSDPTSPGESTSASDEEKEQTAEASDPVKEAPEEAASEVKLSSSPENTECGSASASTTSSTRSHEPSAEEPATIVPESTEKISREPDVGFSEQIQSAETTTNEATHESETNVTSGEVGVTTIGPNAQETPVRPPSCCSPADVLLVAEVCVSTAAGIAISAVGARSSILETSASESSHEHVAKATHVDEELVELQEPSEVTVVLDSNENDGNSTTHTDVKDVISSEVEITSVAPSGAFEEKTALLTLGTETQVSSESPAAMQSETVAVETSNAVQTMPAAEPPEKLKLSQSASEVISQSELQAESSNEAKALAENADVPTTAEAEVLSETDDEVTQSTKTASAEPSSLTTAEFFMAAIECVAVSLVVASREADSLANSPSAAPLHEPTPGESPIITTIAVKPERDEVANTEPSPEIASAAEAADPAAQHASDDDSVLVLSSGSTESDAPSTEPVSAVNNSPPGLVDNATESSIEHLGVPSTLPAPSNLFDTSKHSETEPIVGGENSVSSSPGDLTTSVSSVVTGAQQNPRQEFVEPSCVPASDTHEDVAKVVAALFVEKLTRSLSPAPYDCATEVPDKSVIAKVSAASEAVEQPCSSANPEAETIITAVDTASGGTSNVSPILPHESAEAMSPAAAASTRPASEEAHTTETTEIVPSTAIESNSIENVPECGSAATIQAFVDSIEVAACIAIAAKQGTLESPAEETMSCSIEESEAGVPSTVGACDDHASTKPENPAESVKPIIDRDSDTVNCSSEVQAVCNDPVGNGSGAPADLNGGSLLTDDHLEATKMKHVYFNDEAELVKPALGIEKAVHDFVGAIEVEVLTALTSRQVNGASLSDDKTEEWSETRAPTEVKRNDSRNGAVVPEVAKLFATQAITEVLSRLNHLPGGLGSSIDASREVSDVTQDDSQLPVELSKDPVILKANAEQLLSAPEVESATPADPSAGNGTAAIEGDLTDAPASCIPETEQRVADADTQAYTAQSGGTEITRDVLNELCAAVETSMHPGVAPNYGSHGDDSNAGSVQSDPTVRDGEGGPSNIEASASSSEQSTQLESTAESASTVTPADVGEVYLTGNANTLEEGQPPREIRHDEISNPTVTRIRSRDQLFEPEIAKVLFSDDSTVEVALRELVSIVEARYESSFRPKANESEHGKPVVEAPADDDNCTSEPNPEVPVSLSLENNESAGDTLRVEADDACSPEESAFSTTPGGVATSKSVSMEIDPSVQDAIQELLSAVADDQELSTAHNEGGDGSEPVETLTNTQEYEKVRESERLAIPTSSAPKELSPSDTPLAGVPSDQAVSSPPALTSGDSSYEEVRQAVTELCRLVEQLQQSKERPSMSSRPSFIDTAELEDTVSGTLPSDKEDTSSAVPSIVERPARRSVLFLDMPDDITEAKEAAEHAMKRQVHKRRVSRRAMAENSLAVIDVSRFTSDPTLMAYDARHDLTQPFAMLDNDIFSIHCCAQNGGASDESEVVGKRRTFLQENYSKSLALRQIPAFNYVPVRIKFQWSDFVVATPVSRASSGVTPSVGDGVRLSKSPVEQMRLLQKRGRKLPCGSYVVVSAFIRPLEDGNENLRVQIYDAERVEEFQFDFFEDHMRRYHLESSGLEAQALEFLSHLEFRREQDSIIIKLPDKKVGDAEVASAAETPDAPENRLNSERVMIGDGEGRRSHLADSPRQRHSHYRHQRPASSPEMTSSKLSVRLVDPRPQQSSPCQDVEEGEAIMNESPINGMVHEDISKEEHGVQDTTSSPS